MNSSPFLSPFAFQMDNFTCYLCQVPFCHFQNRPSFSCVSCRHDSALVDSSIFKQKKTCSYLLFCHFQEWISSPSLSVLMIFSTVMSASFPTSYLASRYVGSYCLCSHLPNLYISCTSLSLIFDYFSVSLTFLSFSSPHFVFLLLFFFQVYYAPVSF